MKSSMRRARKKETPMIWVVYLWANEIEDNPIPGETILLIDHLERTPVQAKWTLQDPTLRRILHNILYGWEDNNSDENIRPYFSRRSELSTHNGCILWGSRIVVPAPGRKKTTGFVIRRTSRHGLQKGLRSFNIRYHPVRIRLRIDPSNPLVCRIV
jgi:hypothetical protein